MSMSVDTRQMEVVAQFAAFIEVLTNPEELKRTLDNVKTVLADYNEKLALIKTKEQADAYYAKAQADMQEAKLFLTREQERQNDQLAKALASIAQREAELSRTFETLEKRQAEINTLKSEAERLKNESDKLFVAAFDKNKAAETREYELNRLAEKLNEKQAKLNQILG